MSTKFSRLIIYVTVCVSKRIYLPGIFRNSGQNIYLPRSFRIHKLRIHIRHAPNISLHRLRPVHSKSRWTSCNYRTVLPKVLYIRRYHIRKYRAMVRYILNRCDDRKRNCHIRRNCHKFSKMKSN